MVQNLLELARKSLDTLRIFSSEKPDLIPTGFTALDKQIGGVDPGTASLLLANQHVGKTHSVLHAARNTPLTTGIISLEDGPVLLGSREIAMRCGIDPLRLRRKELTQHEYTLLQEFLDREEELSPRVLTLVGASLGRIVEGIEELAEAGCRLIYLDYIQKVRGHKEDRHQEVAVTFTTCQTAAAGKGAALFCASQVTNVDDFKHPGPWSARESRDLSNEARLILSMRQPEAESPIREFKVWKSSFGSLDAPLFALCFDSAGALRETVQEPEFVF